MKRYTVSVFLIAASLCAYAQVAAANPQLEAVMKVLAKDLALVAEPTKAADPATVKDSVLQTAVVRVRTNAFLLQMASDRRGLVEKGVFTADELTPPGLAGLTVDETGKKLDLYADYLMKAKAKLGEAEALIAVEQKKADPRTRSYVALKAALDQLNVIIGAAHKIFKPAPTP